MQQAKRAAHPKGFDGRATVKFNRPVTTLSRKRANAAKSGSSKYLLLAVLAAALVYFFMRG